jgi:tartrate dehydrogenase/decarboxylase/D-malate dehydrogenase
VASPISTLLSGALMMRHLGEGGAAERLEKAVESVVRQGVLTPDLGGKASTRDVTDAILKHL